MRKKMTILLFSVFFILNLSACGTHRMNLEHTAKKSAYFPDTKHEIATINVKDERKRKGDWIGTTRGGFGNPLFKVRTNGSVADNVKKYYETGLAKYGIYSPNGEGKYHLDISLERLDSNQAVIYDHSRVDVHAKVKITLSNKEKSSNVDAFAKTYTKDFVTHPGPWQATTGKQLAGYMQQTLDDTFASMIQDDEFLAALSAQPVTITANQPAEAIPDDTAEERLKSLKKLFDQGLINKEDYEQKKSDILQSL